MNVVALIGNLTRDPELKTLPSGMTVCDLGVAVNDRRKNPSTGEWEDKPGFYNVTVFGSQGENAAKFLAKGRPVGITGRLSFEQWEKDGQKRSAVKIIANDVQFLGSKDDSAAAPADTSGEPDF